MWRRLGGPGQGGGGGGQGKRRDGRGETGRPGRHQGRQFFGDTQRVETRHTRGAPMTEKRVNRITRKLGLDPGSLVHVGLEKDHEVKVTVIDYDGTGHYKT